MSQRVQETPGSCKIHAWKIKAFCMFVLEEKVPIQELFAWTYVIYNETLNHSPEAVSTESS